MIIETTSGHLVEDVYKLNSSGYTVVKTDFSGDKYTLTAEKVSISRSIKKAFSESSNKETLPKKRGFDLLTAFLNRKSRDV